MQKREPAKISSPFMEIIISFGVLAICSVIIVGVFLGADSLRKKSTDLLTANLKAQSEAEYIFQNAADYQNTTIIIDYDREWQPVSSDGEFVMTISISRQETARGFMTTGKVEIVKNTPYPYLKNSEGALVSYDVKRYDNE